MEVAGAPDFPPWVDGKLRINRSILEEVVKHALATYPSECCGFLFGPTSDGALVNSLRQEENEADKYHQLDPETFPRTSREYFKINELRASRTFEEASRAGSPVKVIYHSHCDAGAYFSREDAATFARDGQLMWPCAFLVVSVSQGQAKDQRLWVHRRGTNEFDESTFEVID